MSEAYMDHKADSPTLYIPRTSRSTPQLNRGSKSSSEKSNLVVGLQGSDCVCLWPVSRSAANHNGYGYGVRLLDSGIA